MSGQPQWTWRVLIGAGLLMGGVLLFREPAATAQQNGGEPFANSVQQRQEIIAQLKETNALLKEQNSLLKSGKLTVMVKNEN